MQSTSPLHLASLAQSAVSAFPHARDGEWFGRGHFGDALSALCLPNAKIVGNYLWDEERHQPPEPTSGIISADLPDAVASLIRAADLPRLPKDTWPHVFKVLACYAAEHEFNLTESTRWSRDELARQGVPVGRPALGFVVRGAQFGGAPLTRKPPPDADELTRAFHSNLLNRARMAGASIGPEDEQALADWLGLASEAKPAAPDECAPG